jgi:ligand-binding SRPBCC domain-containing protein
VPIYEKRSTLPTTAPALFAWHARPGAFERLAPPWEHMRVLARHGGITDGSRLTLELRRGPLKIRWEALHRNFVDGVQFTDEQVAGPFKRWIHTHRVEAAGGGATLIDLVDYALPFGPLGALAGGMLAGRVFDRLFEFRHRRIATDLARHNAVGQGRRLRLVLTGRTGFVLTQLAAFLSTGGHLVHLFPTTEDVRRQPSDAAWGPTAVPDFAALEQADAVVHMGLADLPALLASLDQRRSRARTVVALPTVAVPGVPGITRADIDAAIASTSRRVVVLLTPGVLAAWPALEGSVPREAVTPSVDGALIGLDDLIGATYFAVCDDSVHGVADVTLPRAGATAAVPSAVARWVTDLRVLQLAAPEAGDAGPLTAFGFVPANPTLAATVVAEMGWPPVNGGGGAP